MTNETCQKLTFPAGHNVPLLIDHVLLFFGRFPFELSRLLEFFVKSVRFAMFNALKQKRMVTHLPKFHLDIHQLWRRLSGSAHVEKGVVVFEDGPIVLLLDACQFDIDHSFFLRGDVFGYIFFDAPKHERRYDLLK